MFWGWYRRYYLLLNLPLLFVLTELALVQLDPVHRWPFNEKDDLAKGLTAYEARPPAPGDEIMLLLGNSATDRGMDAEAIERGLGKPHLRVYNFGLKGARIDDQFELLKYLRARGIVPRYVVLGVNTYLIDDEVNADTLYPWLHRTTPYIYFHRSRIRTKLWRWIKSVVGLEKAKAKKPDKDEGDTTQRTPESAVKAFLGEFQGRAPDDFPLIARVPELATTLSAQGITPYVILLPMAPTGTTRLVSFFPLITAMRRALPPASLDLTLSSAYGDELFYDVGHPNHDGKIAITKAITAWLASRPELQRR